MRYSLWYDLDGSICTRERAEELLGDWSTRNVAETTLRFMGWEIKVYTTFVPVDHDPETWGTFTTMPALWVTEIVGGPEDLNGITEYYKSQLAASEGHAAVVERAIASGCSLE